MGSPTAFLSVEVADVIKSISSSLKHVVNKAYPLKPEDIRIISSFLDARTLAPLAAKSCILIAYASFPRASNLTSPSMSVWDSPHTLRACDTIDSSNGLYLCIHSAKTLSGAQPTYLQILPGCTSDLCPVIAWRSYKEKVKPWPFGQAFASKHSAHHSQAHSSLNEARLEYCWSSSGSTCYHALPTPERRSKAGKAFSGYLRKSPCYY